MCIDLRFLFKQKTVDDAKKENPAAADALQLVLSLPNCNPNVTDGKMGMTPLLISAYKGEYECVRLLIECPKTDVHKCDFINGGSPMRYAALNGHDRVVELLLTIEGVDVNKACSSGNTPLICAVYGTTIGTPLATPSTNHERCVELLASAPDIGKSVNQPDASGNTPLSVALKNGSHRSVRALLGVPELDVNQRGLRPGPNEENRVALIHLHEGMMELQMINSQRQDPLYGVGGGGGGGGAGGAIAGTLPPAESMPSVDDYWRCLILLLRSRRLSSWHLSLAFQLSSRNNPVLDAQQLKEAKESGKPLSPVQQVSIDFLRIIQPHVEKKCLRWCAACLQAFPERNLDACGNCKEVGYCSKACQVVHWRDGGHKEECAKLKAEAKPPANFNGLRVWITNTSKQDLNGRVGKVVSDLDETTGRYTVQVDGLARRLALKPKNLEIAEPVRPAPPLPAGWRPEPAQVSAEDILELERQLGEMNAMIPDEVRPDIMNFGKAMKLVP